MLVEFYRANPPVAPNEFGEDDGLQNQVQAQAQRPIAINPTTISAVFESSNDANVTIVRLADGRGFMVQGNYAQVMEVLRANGGVTPAN